MSEIRAREITEQLNGGFPRAVKLAFVLSSPRRLTERGMVGLLSTSTRTSICWEECPPTSVADAQQGLPHVLLRPYAKRTPFHFQNGLSVCFSWVRIIGPAFSSFLPAGLLGAIPPVRGKLPRISNTSASLEVKRCLFCVPCQLRPGTTRRPLGARPCMLGQPETLGLLNERS